jgi:chemotaxis protein MotB
MDNEDKLFLSNENNGEDSKDRWMMTFADLLSLLLVFFILIYATTSVQKGKWEKLKEVMGDSFKPSKIVEREYVTNLHATKIQINKGTDTDYLAAILESKIKNNAFLKNNISLDREKSSLVIKLNSKNIFEGNSPILTEDSRILFFVIGDALQRIKNKIEVMGHTNDKIDNNDMTTWNLALARAVKVASKLREYGNLSKLESMVKNEKPSKNSNKTNNRVDIIIRPNINNVQ